MRKVLASKRENRKRLAELPFAQKLVLLEKLRDRSLAIKNSIVLLAIKILTSGK